MRNSSGSQPRKVIKGALHEEGKVSREGTLVLHVPQSVKVTLAGA